MLIRVKPDTETVVSARSTITKCVICNKNNDYEEVTARTTPRKKGDLL